MALRMRPSPLLRALILLGLLSLLATPAPSGASLEATLTYRHRLEAAGAGEITDLAVVGPYAYLAQGVEGLRIADIRDPVEPAEYVAYSHPAALKYVTAASAHLYGVGPTGELHIFSLDQPRAPALQSSLPLSLTSKLHLRGARAYGLTATGLQIIDVADPQAPAVVGSFALDMPADLAIAGTIAYVLAINAGFYGRLYAIDVADPLHPTLLDTYDHTERGGSTFALSRISLERGAAYLAGGGCIDFCVGGVVVIDITDPTNLRERHFIWVGDSGTTPQAPPSSLVVHDRTALLTVTYCRYACKNVGLIAIKIPVDGAPRKVADLRYPDDVRAATFDFDIRAGPPVIVGTRLFVPMRDKGLLVYTIGSYQTSLPLLR